MQLVVAIDYDSIEELNEKLERYIIDDRGSWLTDGVETVSVGLIWEDDGVHVLTMPDQGKATVYGKSCQTQSDQEEG